jgi:hypothetical protein
MTLDGTAAEHGVERRVAPTSQRDPTEEEVMSRVWEFDDGRVGVQAGVERRGMEVVPRCRPARSAGEGAVELLGLAIQLVLV